MKNWARKTPNLKEYNQLPIYLQVVELSLIALQAPFEKEVRSVQAVSVYGISDKNDVVCAHVYDFEMYFYVADVPNVLTQDKNKVAAEILRSLNQNTDLKSQSKEVSKKELDPVSRVELYEGNSLLYYEGPERRTFYKVVLSHPTLLGQTRSLLQQGLSLEFPETTVFHRFECFESNWAYLNRFMTDHEVTGGCWLKLGRCEQSVCSPTKASAGFKLVEDSELKKSTCGVELYCSKDWVVNVTRNKAVVDKGTTLDVNSIARLRVLSFDIECAMRDGKFPDPKTDAIIQIACSCREKEVQLKVVFCLKETAQIPHTETHCFENEKDLLLAFADFVVKYDPDVVTGYNVAAFDLPYFHTRCIATRSREGLFIGRELGKQLKVPRSDSDKTFVFDARSVRIKGRLVLDLFPVIKSSFKLSSYSLNAVATHFLKEQKDDVQYQIMMELFNGSPEDRKRLAKYCLQDADLAYRLMDKLLVLVNTVEMARVTGISLTDALYAGQQLKMFFLLHTACRKPDTRLLIPHLPEGQKQQNSSYEGAICLEPNRGFYERPIVTLDFASLYPSIMIAHNICYSTLIDPALPQQPCVPNGQLTRAPTGACFVSSSVKKGMLPEILKSLLDARRETRKALRECEKDSDLAMVLNGRQLAYKYVANSIYGVTGTAVGRLPCLEVSSSVTAFGREIICKTKKLVEEEFRSTAEQKPVVIYGDTDSVMIDFLGTNDADFKAYLENKKEWNKTKKRDSVPKLREEAFALDFYCKNNRRVDNRDEQENNSRTKMLESQAAMLKKAFVLGAEAEVFVNARFASPLRIEFEKIYFPYLLINKKRYAGMFWTDAKCADKMDAKGIELVRRDNCALVRKVLKVTLEKILRDCDVEAALAFVKEVVSRLVQGKVDLSELIITKSLSNTLEKYKVKTPHVELALKMARRSSSQSSSSSKQFEPKSGDRIAYVVVEKPGKNVKVYEKAEDPLYVLENHLPVDYEYYLKHQLALPLERILEPIVGDVNKLFCDASARTTKRIRVPNKALAMFVTVKETCKGCSRSLKTHKDALCEECVGNAVVPFLKALQNVRSDAKRMAMFWTSCQSCQEDAHQEILCTNSDCAIYYSRTKAIKDFQDSKRVFEKFLNQFT